MNVIPRWLLVFLILPGAAGAEIGLQERIESALAGETLHVTSGIYHGPIRIDKPITLKGDGWPAIDGGRAAHVIHILAPDVRIEGFELRASGSNLSSDHAGIMIEGDRARILGNRVKDCLHGIYIKRAKDCVVSGNRVIGKTEVLMPVEDALTQGLRLTPDGEMCIIDLDVNQRGNGIHMWNSSGHVLAENQISGTRDGMYFSFTDRVSARNNYVHHVRYGLHYMYSDENVFENNRFEQNAAGAAIMYSKGLFVRGNRFVNNQGRRAYGLLLQSLDDTTFLDNRIGNNTVGIYLENSNRNVFTRNIVASNYIGARFTASSQENAFSSNSFTRNLHSVELDRDSAGNQWASVGTGNYWSSARPVDLDGDGRGEFAHREADLLGARRRDFPLIGLLSNTPALRLLEFAQSRVRMPGIPAIEDPAPLMRSPVSDD